jgi:hypothetical protein
MTNDGARRRILLLSLAITGILLPFLFIGPAAGYPLTAPQASQLISMIVPVFLSYLGSAVAFVFLRQEEQEELGTRKHDLLSIVVNGGFLVFAICLVSLFGAFGFSNRLSAPPGGGMPFADLSTGVTTVLGIMTTTVGASIVYLFGRPQDRQPR